MFIVNRLAILELDGLVYLRGIKAYLMLCYKIIIWFMSMCPLVTLSDCMLNY